MTRRLFDLCGPAIAFLGGGLLALAVFRLDGGLL